MENTGLFLQDSMQCKYLFWLGTITATSCFNFPSEANRNPEIQQSISNSTVQQNLINPEGQHMQDRIQCPPDAQRLQSDDPYVRYLRQLKLLPHESPVHLFNGAFKNRQDVHAAVLDLEIGARDLQQCADAVMRLRADFLYQQKKYEQIQFQFTNGFVAKYEFWRKGQGILVTGNQCSWVPSARAGSSQQHYKNYLETVFSYAGSLSLSHQLKSVPITQILPGDVLIIGGSPGHAVTVMDIAVQKNTGKKYMLLAQSYMPAQQIHVLKNWEDERISPWFEVPESGKIETPEYTFQTNNLMRF